MMMVALSGMLIGGVLGLRFSVLVLIPTLACASIFAVGRVLLGGLDLGATVIELTLILVFLQVGYLGGSAFQLLFISQAAGRNRNVPSRDRWFLPQP
jgi:hypothetical protein